MVVVFESTGVCTRNHLSCVLADNIQNPRSKLGPSSISLVHASSIEVFLTLSIGLAVELDSTKAKAPSRH